MNPASSISAVAGVCALVLAAATAGAQSGGGLARLGPGREVCVELRQQAADESAVLDCLPAGTLVVLLDSAPGWREVLTDDGRRGWVVEELLATEPEPESVPAAAAEPVDPPPAAESATLAAELESLTRERDDLRLQLGAAEAQITALHADLQAERAAFESSQSEAADLRSALEAARADNETLTEQLRSSEGRQIFLLAELDKSRAEIRRLERLAALASPSASPAPVDATPPPSAPAPGEPLPGVPEPIDPALSEASSAAEEEVLATILAWARAWSEQRLEDYLAFYSSEFRPADGSARGDWEAGRRERVSHPGRIEVSLDQIFIQVEGDLARAGFRQSYSSDNFGDVVSKSLLLRREAGSWRILEETAAP